MGENKTISTFDPAAGTDYKVIEHRSSLFPSPASKLNIGWLIKLYRPKKIKDGGTMTGEELLKEVSTMKLPGAEETSYLCVDDNRVPLAWQSENDTLRILFLGTIYQDPATGKLYAEALCFDGNWGTIHKCISGELTGDIVVAVIP